MTQPPVLFDRAALLAHRARAQSPSAFFLHQIAADEIKERLKEVNRTFTSIAIVTGAPDIWTPHWPGATIVDDDDVLELAVKKYDLVVHAMTLHWANDPVGQLVQCKRALKPDGLFLGVAFGGQTLAELRAALGQAEIDISGGLSPRIAPMGEIRDLGALLQRAGFALPVADNLSNTVTYKDAFALMHDLRAAGECNVLSDRQKKFAKRHLFQTLNRIYKENFPADGERISATFEFIFLTGWAPDASQPKPLRPGSATQRLADALGTTELDETATPITGAHKKRDEDDVPS